MVGEFSSARLVLEKVKADSGQSNFGQSIFGQSIFD